MMDCTREVEAYGMVDYVLLRRGTALSLKGWVVMEGEDLVLVRWSE